MKSNPPSPTVRQVKWLFRLYISGQTPRALMACTTITKICEEYLKGRYNLKIIDILQNPSLAAKDEIIAAPTLVRYKPKPVIKITGNLSKSDYVINTLHLD